MKRYSAKLLFKYVGCAKEHGRWLCESRIITIFADSPFQAYDFANEYGMSMNSPAIEYVGVLKIVSCDLILDKDETWYEMCTHKNPHDLILSKDVVVKNA